MKGVIPFIRSRVVRPHACIFLRGACLRVHARARVCLYTRRYLLVCNRPAAVVRAKELRDDGAVAAATCHHERRVAILREGHAKPARQCFRIVGHTLHYCRAYTGSVENIR